LHAGAVATPAPASASPATPAASPTPTSAATSGATAGTAQVDLHFTGAKTFDAVGSAGRCSLGTPVGGGLPSFGFEATEADYPGMGLSFSLLQFAGADYVDLKWTIDASTIYGQAGPVYTAGPNTITLSPDHRMVTLDAQLSGFAPQGQAPPGPGHVTGTITCP
jgi:hypothetical protein